MNNKMEMNLEEMGQVNAGWDLTGLRTKVESWYDQHDTRTPKKLRPAIK